MRHFIGFVLPSEGGSWRVLVPDVPELTADGAIVEGANENARLALVRMLEESGTARREPRDLRSIMHDEDWLSRNGIEISRTIISVLPVAGT